MKRKSRLSWFIVAMLIGMMLVVSACGGANTTGSAEPAATEGAGAAESSEESAPSTEQAPIPVRLASDGFILGTQSWIALDRGFFAEENLDAEVSVYGTGLEAIQAVIARQADIGPALDFAVLNLAAAAQENMRIVASIAAPDPGFHSLAVRKDINGPQDLIGKKIGYVEGTSVHYVTIRYLEKNSIPLDQVTLVPFPGLFELVGALRTNDIQAAWVWLTGTTEASQDENLKILTDDSDVLGTTGIYLVTSAEWAEANQDTLVRVLRAYDKANAVVENEPEAAAQIVAKAVSGDAAQFAKIFPKQHYAIRFTQDQLDVLDSVAQFLIESGRLPADFNVKDFIDFTAMEIAVPGSVEVDLGK